MTADRVPSDHSSVRTVDATLDRQGPTNRPCVIVDAEDSDAIPTGEVVRVVLDGSERRARPDGRREVTIRGVYDTPAEARDPADATDRLADWVDETGLSFGRTVHLDVVERGFRYGLRAPGEHAVYDAASPPSSSLRGIADRTNE